MNRQYLIYGGIGAVVLAGGYFLYSRNAATTANVTADQAAADSAYYPPIVYGSGGVATDTTATDDGGLGALLAQQAVKNQQDYDISTLQINSDQTVNLADLATQKAIALDTNATSLKSTLASQFGSILASMKGEGNSILGTEGFISVSTDGIGIDLQTQQAHNLYIINPTTANAQGLTALEGKSGKTTIVPGAPLGPVVGNNGITAPTSSSQGLSHSLLTQAA